MFNLQSGIHRRQFPTPLTPAQARKQKLEQLSAEARDPLVERESISGPGKGKHAKAVTGLLVDSLNRTIISCSLDGKIKFWDFMTGNIRYEIDWHPMAAITAARYHRSSDLVAVSCDDLSIRIIDIETRKLVRELWGCIGQIKDFCFSNDGRWIVAASVDSVIRVWDLPTGHLVDAFRVEGSCTALAFSPTGEFLATAHANNISINIWTNRSLFTRVPTRNLEIEEIAQASAPTASGEGGQSLVAAAFEDSAIEDGNDEVTVASLDQLGSEMATLSLVPRSRWQTLLYLDKISERNKPMEPPKAPEKAPFFLPSLEKDKSDRTLTQELPLDATPSTTAAERSRISALQRHGASRPFTNLLHKTVESSSSLDPFITHLKSLAPAATDIEIRSLTIAGPINELEAFVRVLTSRLRQKRDYDLIQAWMAVFLKVHGEAVPANEQVSNALRDWRVVQQEEAQRLGSLIGYCGGVVSFLRSGR